MPECDHKGELCSCVNWQKEDLAVQVNFLMNHFEFAGFELEYTTLEPEEGRRLCKIGRCRACGKRLCLGTGLPAQGTVHELLTAINSLLTALNERKYTNEGRTYPIPTVSFFAATNEIPNFNDPQEKILEALYDRLELKVVTDNIADRDKRLAVLAYKQAGRSGQISASITLDELVRMQQEVADIPVPDAANELADDILCQLRKDGIPVSDRKYLNYYPIAQAKAWLSGHKQVEAQDLLALKNYLWQKPGDRPVVESTLNRMCVNPMQDKVNNVRAMALDV